MTFPSPDELSPDLEWMLQSGQVSTETLLEALMEEYYLSVLHLAQSLLDDEGCARRAAQDAFTALLMDVYHYQERTGMDAWVFRHTWRACQKARVWVRLRRWRVKLLSDSRQHARRPALELAAVLEGALWSAIQVLREPDRQLLILRYLHGWDEGTIAHLLNYPTKEVIARLHDQRLSLMLTIQRFFLHLGQDHMDLDQGSLEELLPTVLRKRWPTPESSAHEFQAAFHEIIACIQKKRFRRSTWVWMKESALVGVLIAVGAATFWGISKLWPEDPFVSDRTDATSLQTVVWPVLITPDGARWVIGPADQPYEALYLVKSGDSFEALQTRMGYPLAEILSANRIPPDGHVPFGRFLLVPYQLTPGPTHAATPVSPSMPQLASLEGDISSEDLLRRLNIPKYMSYTLWMDATIYDYGPLSYLGPPRVKRHQVWTSQDQFLVLFGMQEHVLEVWLFSDDKRYLARPGEGQPFFELWGFNLRSDMIDDSTFLRDTVFNSGKLGMNTTLQTGEREMVAGHDALVVDVLNQGQVREARLWLDDRIGLVLKKQFFAGKQGETMTHQVIVTQVAFNIDFPQELFDPHLPWRGDFAFDSSGQPEVQPTEQPSESIHSERPRLPFDDPPADFDPSQSNLNFQYPATYVERNSLGIISLFGDGFYLGRTPFGNPWKMICARSPDGSWLAFVSNPQVFEQSNGGLRWFRLDEPLGFVHKVLEEYLITQFSFSPESRRLAAFGRHAFQNSGRLFLIDLQSNKTDLIIEVESARSLVWSPDGNRLGMIARLLPYSALEHIQVVLVADGTVTYRTPKDLLSGGDQDTLTMYWGVDFPVLMGGMDTCAQPPK